MGQKLCPLSFFSFYINKESAQAGGSHECVEDSCAIWDESCQQCHLKSGLESLSLIADVVAGLTDISKSVNKESPITDILSRLRAKKKLNDEINLSKEVVQIKPETTEPLKTNLEQTTFDVSLPKISDVTIPPKIPVSELPIVSLIDSEGKNV